MLLYLFTTIICFHVFGPDSITQVSQSVLDLLKQIEFRFLERFDIVFLLFYLSVVSTSWVSFICGSLLLMNPTQKSPSVSYQLFCILLIGMGIAVISPLSWEQSEQYQKVLSYIRIIIVYCFSLLLWLYPKSPLFHNRSQL
ncbi:GerAB/ArcD/ProY family transporter [Bacillus sp. SRB3LM]|nr:GerAB/ArcD/ProY family transporter [Bacillus sp. SRB3LM]